MNLSRVLREKGDNKEAINLMSISKPRSIEHQMTRVDISTGIAFDEFRRAFEQATPAFDTNAIRELTDTGGTWDEVKHAMAASAPHELLIYAMIDATPLFGAAGHTTRAVEYLVGNHVIAETMFGHDPKVLLYAPLRILIHSDAAGEAVFSIDRPSTAFASLGIPEVSDVGISLDHKVATLLQAIGVHTVEALTDQTQPVDS